MRHIVFSLALGVALALVVLVPSEPAGPYPISSRTWAWHIPRT